MVGTLGKYFFAVCGLATLLSLVRADDQHWQNSNNHHHHHRPNNSIPAFNKAGNVLISDQFNNRVIEVDRNTKEIAFSFGSGDPSQCNPGPTTVIGANWAERISHGWTLIAGTGTPANVSDALPDGCVDNRVFVVNANGVIIWQYGQAGVAGNGSNELNVPVAAIQLPSNNILVTDQGNNRIIEIDWISKQVVFEYGPPGVLNSPNSAELLENGHILIADENNNRWIEIDRNRTILHQFSQGLDTVAFASRLPNGNTLITDSGHARIVEYNADDSAVVWEYFTNTTAGSNPNPLPTNAVRLHCNQTSIADQFNHRAIIVDDITKEIVFQYGVLNQPGNGSNQLNGPYTAFVVRDYTGQTAPPVNGTMP